MSDMFINITYKKCAALLKVKKALIENIFV